MANILAVGIATLDIINTTDGFPTEDSEVRAISQETRRGGNATNTLVVLSQLGHQCQWLGCLAKDLSAKIIVNDLDHYNINHENCEIYPGGITPTSYITLNTHNGSRTIVHFRDLPEFSAESFKHSLAKGVDWIHFEGRNVEATKEILTKLREQDFDAPISIEIEKHRENLETLFTGADIYFFSRAFALSNNFNNAELFLRAYREKISDALLVCTWGSEGAYALDNEEMFYSQSPAISPVIDTIGAGDTFNAGFIHASLSDNNLRERLNFACELAAKKCSVSGFANLV